MAYFMFVCMIRKRAQRVIGQDLYLFREGICHGQSVIKIFVNKAVVRYFQRLLESLRQWIFYKLTLASVIKISGIKQIVNGPDFNIIWLCPARIFVWEWEMETTRDSRNLQPVEDLVRRRDNLSLLLPRTCRSPRAPGSPQPPIHGGIFIHFRGHALVFCNILLN